MKVKFIFLTSLLVALKAFAVPTGWYLGGGIGDGSQDMSANGVSGSVDSGTVRVFGGYQAFSFLGAEAGYTYITRAGSWNNMGSPSTTVYDLALTPGVPLFILPITIFARLGIDAVSANLNTDWATNSVAQSYEWGGGLKLDMPLTNIFLRAEYINFGSVTNNDNSSIKTSPSALLLDIAYVF